MIHLERHELKRFLSETRKTRALHHVMFLTAFWHGLRVSELLDIQGADVQDGQLSIRRTKQGRTPNGKRRGPKTTVQPIRRSGDLLFDESPLIGLAQQNSGRLFPYTRQYLDLLMKEYGRRAGLHRSKCHMHALRHTLCVFLWDATHDLSAIQDYVGHRAPASTLIYMRHDAVLKANRAIATMAL